MRNLKRMMTVLVMGVLLIGCSKSEVVPVDTTKSELVEMRLRNASPGRQETPYMKFGVLVNEGLSSEKTVIIDSLVGRGYSTGIRLEIKVMDRLESIEVFDLEGDHLYNDYRPRQITVTMYEGDRVVGREQIASFKTTPDSPKYWKR